MRCVTFHDTIVCTQVWETMYRSRPTRHLDNSDGRNIRRKKLRMATTLSWEYGCHQVTGNRVVFFVLRTDKQTHEKVIVHAHRRKHSRKAWSLGLHASFYLFHHPLASLFPCTSAVQQKIRFRCLPPGSLGSGGILPDVSLASQSPAWRLRLLQTVGPQRSESCPLASQGSHAAGCHRHFVHRLTTLASVAPRAWTSTPSF